MDRRVALAASAALLVVLALGCKQPQQAAAPAADAPATAESLAVVAEIGGTPVTSGELDEWIRDDLFQREVGGKAKAELFEFRSDALDRMIDERILEAEAGKGGVTVEELLTQQVKTGGAVSDEDVSAFYEQNKARMGAQTLEQIGPRIRRFLEERATAEARQNFVRSLREAANVSVMLEAPRVTVAAEGPGRGNPDAPITIVEFSDYQCPFCQRAEPIVAEVLKRYPDQVRLVFRHFPLDQIHPRARAASEASLCADEQGKFWEFHEKLFGGGGLEEADLVAYGEAVGLDKEKFEACVKERRYQAKVEADSLAGREAGVSGTPAFFVNGIMLSGAKPVEAFVEVIERELKAPPKS